MMYSLLKLAIFSFMAIAAPEVDTPELSDEMSTEQMDHVLSKLEKLSEQIESQVSALEETAEESADSE